MHAVTGQEDEWYFNPLFTNKPMYKSYSTSSHPLPPCYHRIFSIVCMCMQVGEKSKSTVCIGAIGSLEVNEDHVWSKSTILHIIIT